MEVSDAAETAHLGRQELVMWLVHVVHMVVATAVAAGDSLAVHSAAILAVDASTAGEVPAARYSIVYSGLPLEAWTVFGNDSDAEVRGLGHCEVDADGTVAAVAETREIVAGAMLAHWTAVASVRQAALLESLVELPR